MPQGLRDAHWSGSPAISQQHWQSTAGDSMMLGALLGEIKSGQANTIHALELIRAQLEANARLMAERLPVVKASRSTEDTLKLVREFIQTLIPIGLLVLLAIGKLKVADVWPLIRQTLGLPG